jgi:predicted nucleotidyltransferase
MLLNKLKKKELIHPPQWLPNNCVYLVQMGSVAYGVSNDNSDIDVYGYCIPPKDMVFPHLAGEILGFGRKKKRFEQWQEHHIEDKESRKEYDFSVYGIVKYFSLVMENNPNMIDSLFVPQRCIIHNTMIGEMVRERRKIFLHKGCFHKFKGYAFSQASKMKSKGHKFMEELTALESKLGIPKSTTLEQAQQKRNQDDYDLCLPSIEKYIALYEKMVQAGKRSERCKIYGYDVKFAYHIIRLVSECEQILTEGDLVLDEYGRREQMKAIRNGEWSLEQVEEFFQMKEKHLEELYHKSDLPHKPDEEAIKALLMDCLEHHYGSLSACVVREDKAVSALREISKIIERSGV